MFHRDYYVGGSFSYRTGNRSLSMPLSPALITVTPDPSLHVHYFMEKHAQGDDPFTKGVREPSIPFSLGVAIKNEGFGIASNVRMSSEQPEIIDNEKGLKVS